MPTSPEERELRLAVVMTGGVSLAIWMGGVALELDRLLHRDDGYGQLLDLAAYVPRVDVVAGTSAGGLNGALLAASVARGVRMQGLKEVWLRTAAFEKLLRPAAAVNPPSVLQGEYFLENLLDVFAKQFEEPPKPPRHPVDLFVTTTLLRGEDSRLVDGYGTLIPDTDHHGLFHFHKRDLQPPRAALQLSIAARSSASFPIAFEPAWAAKDQFGPLASFRSNHYVVDGGVLVNRPLGPALDAIYAQPASAEEVERVLLYVIPDPGTPELGIDQPEPGYSVAKTGIDSLISIPRHESVKRELEELRRHNLEVDRRRKAREVILDTWFVNNGRFPDPDAERELRRAYDERLADELLKALMQAWPNDMRLDFRRERYLKLLKEIRALVAGADNPAVVQESAAIALGFVRYAFAYSGDEARERLALPRERLHEVLRELRRFRAERAARIQRPNRDDFADWAQAQASRYLEHGIDLDRLADTVATQTRIAADIVRDNPRFSPYTNGLAPEGADVRERLTRLQAIEHALGVERPRIEQTVGLMQVSANTRDAFGVADSSGKLAGMRLGHFGAFYKPSWRANDWLWGRLDAAGWLVELLLQPERLRDVPDLATKIFEIAVDGPYKDWLAEQYDAEAIALEIRGIQNAVDLPECNLAVARRLQLEILAEDLPTVAAAVASDRELGAESETGRAFLRAWEQPVGAERLVGALRACRFGEEGFDVRTKLLQVDAAQAASVATGALEGSRSGLPGFLRPVFRWLHWFALAAYRYITTG